MTPLPPIANDQEQKAVYWMEWFEDSSNPIDYYRNKYGVMPNTIEVPLRWSKLGMSRLTEAGLTVIEAQNCQPGCIRLARI